MRVWVSAWLDGKLAGFAKRYTEWHVAHCEQCAAAIPYFRRVLERMHGLAARGGDGLGDERWQRISAALDEVDAKDVS